MKPAYLFAASAAALAAGFGGMNFPERTPGAPFVDPIEIARSVCGKDQKAALKRRLYFQAIGAAYAASLGAGDEPAQTRMRPVEGIGYQVTTISPKAQAYFDAGLAHTWNFNHGEANIEFMAAQKEDPDCAMCFWAEAFAWGPNINAPMGEEAVAPAYAALEKASAL
jgi:hypothetical protein